jgi:hypothetical protein
MGVAGAYNQEVGICVSTFAVSVPGRLGATQGCTKNGLNDGSP